MIKGLLCFFLLAFGSLQSFEKVIIWGHTLHSHTHSYIHHGFYKAFKHLGYEVHWMDEKSDVSHLDLANSLFITEGQVDAAIPKRSDCFYMLHNTDRSKYSDIDRAHYAFFQVYSDDVLKRPTAIEQEKCIHFDRVQRVLYMPWATDLLPHEIDEVKEGMKTRKEKKQVVFMGTLNGTWPENNVDVFNAFCSEAKNEGYEIITNGNFRSQKKGKISNEDTIRAIQVGLMAPALQGPMQVEMGYIPCRIFKNVSYGKVGITNSKRVWELFDGNIVYDSDPVQLFYKAQKRLDSITLEEVWEMMDVVKQKHTYINRIQTMLEFIEQLQELSSI